MEFNWNKLPRSVYMFFRGTQVMAKYDGRIGSCDWCTNVGLRLKFEEALLEFESGERSAWGLPWAEEIVAELGELYHGETPIPHPTEAMQ